MTNFKHEDKMADEATLLYGTLKRIGYNGNSFDSYLVFNNSDLGAFIEYEDQGGYFKITILDKSYALTIKYEEGNHITKISETCLTFDEFISICDDYIYPEFSQIFNEVKEFFS